MQDASAPLRFGTVWAVNAGASFITYPVPTASQIGVTNGAASFNDGFPPNTFLPLSAGGAGPYGKDYNGLLKQLSAGMQWAQAGGPLPYDTTFGGLIGGYPKGSFIASATGIGLGWLSTAENNNNNPDSGGANWSPAVVAASSNRLNAACSSVYTFAGNPNGSVAGTAATATTPPDMVWDTTNSFIWVCTTTGNAAGAVWKRPAVGQPLAAPTTVTATGAYSVAVPAGAALCVAQGWGAGGGGGHTNTPGSDSASGGSAGAYGTVNLDVRAGGNVTGTVGVGGAGSSTAAAASQGGNTTVIYNAVTYTAGGGPGGISQQSPSANSPALSTVSGAWTQTMIGQQGNIGFVAGGVVVSGQGGQAPLGGAGGTGGGGLPGAGAQPGGGGGGVGGGAGSGANGGNGQVTLTFF